MASQNSNGAYDFALFEPKKEQKVKQQKNNNVIKLPKEKLELNRREKVKPVKAVLTFLAFAVMLGIVGTIVYGQVQLTELTEELNSANKTLSETQSVYTQLKMKSNSQLSLEVVEKRATNEMGLKKIEQNQIEPISLAEGDKTEVVKSSSNENWFTSFWDSIIELLS